MRAVYWSINRSWEAYIEGSVGPSDFMRTPFGAAYQIVTIEGKGRGIIASRDIAAGEVVLRETPVLVAPIDSSNFLLFLLLPQKAIEAVPLLHNAHPQERPFSLRQDIPLHRLLDIFSGIMSTNSFGVTATNCQIGILLLTGSLFNHSDTPNVARTWDAEKEQEIFVSLRDIKKGEELVHDYVPGVQGRTRREKLKQYGI
ncbi:putative set domain-containing protein [Eutypa lata UCREL1]|uniref:Putative set domain-containing protein n=1 Tax=Eutypa lata (strain UCR-EL1) TaxID=1287681 RepID=M7T4N5_EUTLA|nr:putative set domain-containing protein [Eutypa lata UCREL1]